MENDDEFRAKLLNPMYHKRMFQSLSVPYPHSKATIFLLSSKCSALQVECSKESQSHLCLSSPDHPSDPEKTDILKHLNETPISLGQELTITQEDKVLTYL
ncbi:hypothetical protein O181_010661 [Austropuccinia psidii MF-1]|uniref:Uncharacterized protein n=1 Tax=Austropuccinia psidii MF-1 TaxID=1389203 RepID=A0A9Q3BU84_9BASI|nr:hypothetical protein [Austropuccinia psidii MF-1]